MKTNGKSKARLVERLERSPEALELVEIDEMYGFHSHSIVNILYRIFHHVLMRDSSLFVGLSLALIASLTSGPLTLSRSVSQSITL